LEAIGLAASAILAHELLGEQLFQRQNQRAFIVSAGGDVSDIGSLVGVVFPQLGRSHSLALLSSFL